MMFDAFDRTGLGPVAAGILAELLRLGGDRVPIIASALARRLGVSKASVAAALARMARDGMITRAGRSVTLNHPAAWSATGGPVAPVPEPPAGPPGARSARYLALALTEHGHAAQRAHYWVLPCPPRRADDDEPDGR